MPSSPLFQQGQFVRVASGPDAGKPLIVSGGPAIHLGNRCFAYECMRCGEGPNKHIYMEHEIEAGTPEFRPGPIPENRRW